MTEIGAWEEQMSNAPGNAPWIGSGDLVLNEKPYVHSSSMVIDSSLGCWTLVGPGSVMVGCSLGDYSYVMDQCILNYAIIGKFCNIASHSCLNPGNHPLERASLHHFTYRSRSYQLSENDDLEFFHWRRQQPVVLDHDVWIGHGAIVLPGVRIGTGAAVGAGAVVTHDVDPYTVVAGVPAKPLRKRFDETTIEALMRICWWNWSHEKLKESLPDFRRLSGAEFVKRYKL